MIVPPPIGDNWQRWAESVRRALQRMSILEAYTPAASAAEDGAMLFDRDTGCPVVSYGGAWRQICGGGGIASLDDGTPTTDPVGSIDDGVVT